MAQGMFIIEGNMGAGKSTLLQHLKHHLFIDAVYEPCKKWQSIGGTHNLLEHYYQEKDRWAYTFQTYSVISRLEEQRKQSRYATSPVQVLERSVFSDRYCFAQVNYELGTMNELEWTLYQEWSSWIIQLYGCMPDGFIYVQVDPEVCFKRMNKRNRSEEQHVTLDYLKLLHEKHEEWLLKKRHVMPELQDVPVLLIPGNEEFETDPFQLKQHVKTISEFITSFPAPPNTPIAPQKAF